MKVVDINRPAPYRGVSNCPNWNDLDYLNLVKFVD